MVFPCVHHTLANVSMKQTCQEPKHVVPGQSAKRWLLWLSKQQPKLRRSKYRSRFGSFWFHLPVTVDEEKNAEAVRMVEFILMTLMFTNMEYLKSYFIQDLVPIHVMF